MPRPQSASLAAEDEAALVARARRNDPAALAELMRRNNRRLYRAAWGILRDEQEAEDAVQDCYLKAFAALAKFRGEAALTTWLTRIVINEALMRRRRGKRLVLEADNVVALRRPGIAAGIAAAEAAAEPDAESPEGAVQRGRLRQFLQAEIADLPEQQRAVFVLRAVEEFSVEETAQLLAVNPQTVRTRFLRARRRLQARVQAELKLSLAEMLPFDGARCNRLTARVLARLEAIPPAGTAAPGR